MESERYLLNEEAMRQYIVQGVVTVQADMPAGFHQQIARRLDTVLDTEGNWGNNILPRIPEIRQVFQHPAVDGALTSILGPHYILHPHRYPHCNLPGSAAQTLHKDSTHYSGDVDIRHHRSRWAMAFYYPQEVTEEMGPTSILPGTPYYEEHSHDSDNAERLLCGPAGTVTIVNFDIWHRATANRSQKRRYMLKFIFARTEEPGVSARHAVYSDWPLPRNAADEKHPLAWRSLWNWIRGEDSTAACNAVHFDKGDLTASVQALQKGDSPARRRAANMLGLMGPAAEQAVPALITSLQDEDEAVRLNASYALGTIGAAAVPALLATLRAGTEIGRRHASCALSIVGKAAVPALLHAAEDADWRVRAAAVDALGEIGSAASEVLPTLMRTLSDEADWVRRHAADAVGTIGTPAQKAVPALIPLLKDAQPYVRINAATALIKIGPAAEEAVPALVEALADPDRYVRGFAVLALRRIGTPQAQEALFDLLETARWCPVTAITSPY
jgi:HEAT repeat protein